MVVNCVAATGVRCTPVIAAAFVVAIAIGFVASPPRAAAQGGSNFEVASVKPNTSGETRSRIGFAPGGRFTATNMPLRFLLTFVYDVQDFQLVGGPDWLASDRFDFMATA